MLATILLLFELTANVKPVSLDDDSTKSAIPTVTVAGFADAYYAYDFTKPGSRNIPFAYNHARHNEFSVNLALLKIGIAAERFRGNVGFQAGTYPLSNYQPEPEHFRHIYDANVGIKLRKGLWLEAGIWGSSHIGFEEAVSLSNWTLTRSLAAEYTPYYESGARLTYETGKWMFRGLLLNGWQNITETNENKALGTQIAWISSDKLKLNYGTIFTNEQPDSAAQYRLLNNLFGIFQLSKKWGFTAGFDLGLQQRAGAISGYHFWYNPTLIVRYSHNNQLHFAARGEYYHDPFGVIVMTWIPDAAFQVVGYSVNADYRPHPNVALRIEGRVLHNRQPIFPHQKILVKSRPTLTTSLAVSL